VANALRKRAVGVILDLSARLQFEDEQENGAKERNTKRRKNLALPAVESLYT